MSHAALAMRLPRIEPRLAALQTRLLAAIDGAPAGSLALHARLADADAAAAIRFSTPGGDIEVAPLLVEGGVPMLHGDDGKPDAVSALATLAGLEPLIAAVERCLGVALRPSGIGRAELPLRLHVEARDATGVIHHAVVLGFDESAGFSPPPQPARFDASIGRLVTGFSFLGAGPTLARHRIEALAVGDLVLIGGRELAGAVETAGQRWPARLAPATATITINQGTPRVSDAPDANLDPDLRLALSLRIDGGSVSLADLARLTPGSVLPLGIAGAAMPVTLEIGGAAVATGELVAVGEAYGVLITGRTGTVG